MEYQKEEEDDDGGGKEGEEKKRERGRGKEVDKCINEERNMKMIEKRRKKTIERTNPRPGNQ